MLFAIKPFEIHDGDGIRTTVFFKGCALKCKWCHNPESFSCRKEILYRADACVNCLACTTLCEANTRDGEKHIFDRSACTVCGKCEAVCQGKAFETAGFERDADELAEELSRDAMFYAASGGGVTFSGGEPLLQIDDCVRLAKRLCERNISVYIDTSAFVPRTHIDAILPYTDAFLFDVKAIHEDVHVACTGQKNGVILDNIRYADEKGVPFELRYPFVPGYNDGEAEEIGKFAASLTNLRVLRILPYHSYAEPKYAALGMPYPLSDVPVPTKEQLENARETIRLCGVKNVTIG